jgi:hypothetical protein
MMDPISLQRRFDQHNETVLAFIAGIINANPEDIRDEVDKLVSLFNIFIFISNFDWH